MSTTALSAQMLEKGRSLVVLFLNRRLLFERHFITDIMISFVGIKEDNRNTWKRHQQTVNERHGEKYQYALPEEWYFCDSIWRSTWLCITAYVIPMYTIQNQLYYVSIQSLSNDDIGYKNMAWTFNFINIWGVILREN